MPQATDLNTEIKDLAANVASMKEAQDTLLAKLADDGDLLKAPDAIRELEKQFAQMSANLDERMAKMKRQTFGDFDNRYQGVFANEDEARAFGLYVLSRQANWDEESDMNARRATEALKADYGVVQRLDRAMDSVGDGAVIPPEFSTRVQRLVEEFGVFERNVFTMPMAGDSLSFPRRTGGVTVFRIGENAAGTASEPSLGNVTLNAHEDGTLTYVPRTLGEDAAVEIGELIAMEIALAFSEAYDDFGFNGTGSAAHLGYVGVIPRLTAVNGVDDGGGLVLGAGNEWSDLTQANFNKLTGILPTYVRNPQFFCSRPFFFEVMVKLMHAAGGVTAAEIEGRRRLMFNGDPVEIAQKLPRTQSNSQVCVLYGSLRQAATMGRRRGLTLETSRFYKFAERQVTYLATRRTAITVHDVGTATEAGPIVGLITAAS
jgi:HK97 family phage major capsid protein